MICHDVIGRRKMAFDNLIKGLETLSFHSEMKKKPDRFKQFFERHCLTPEVVLEAASFSTSVSEKIRGFFNSFVMASEDKLLKSLLLYCTGAPVVPFDGFTVTSEKSSSIHANTCIKTLTIPDSFAELETFKAAMVSVMGDCSGKSFNTL